MYSMVLMAALTTGTDVPDCGNRGGCCGCYGGYGGYGGYGYGCGGYGGYGYGGYGYGGYGGYGYGWGGWGVGGGGYGSGSYAAATVAPYYATPVPATNPLPSSTDTTRSMYYSPDTSASNRATIIIHLPDNAQLLVDGKATASTSATRRFYSPPLEVGKNYHYNFEARVERDGKIVKMPQRVDVRAGERRDITISREDVDRAAERK